jgi:hypothetical protein
MRDDGQNQLKISAPHPMTETYQLIPLVASLISLDSPFKVLELYSLPDIQTRISAYSRPHVHTNGVLLCLEQAR